MSAVLQATWSVLLELAPWLLLGAVVAGVLHWLLPSDFVRRYLGGRGGVGRAVALGVPLPLCSCGVIPAGLGLKKDGASDGASVGFLISTPQTGVDSILVSASFLGWPFALFKVVSAAVMGWLGGVVTDRRAADRTASSAAAPNAQDDAHPSRPTFRDAVDHTVDVLRTIWRWLVLGVLASAAITAFLPDAALAGLAERGEIVALSAALLVSLPLYVCATASVPIAAALVAGGFPPGAALVFLMAGPATNIATMGAVYRAFGRRVLTIYVSTIVIGSVAGGWMFDTLFGFDAARHFHAHGGGAWWAVVSALALMGLLGWFAVEDLRASVRRFRMHRARPAPAIVVPVSGMTCDGCVRKLERALHSDTDVVSTNITLEPGLAEIRGHIDEARVRALIESAGFTAS